MKTNETEENTSYQEECKDENFEKATISSIIVASVMILYTAGLLVYIVFTIF